MMFATSVHIIWCIFLVSSVVVETEAYLLNLGVMSGGQEIILEAGTTEYNIKKFKNCLCDNYLAECSISFRTVTTTNSEYRSVTQVTSSKENGVNYFVCSVNVDSWSFGNEISCNAVKSDIIPCTTNPCSVNINIDCGRKPNATIVWNSTEEARVYNSNNVTLLDCCSTSTTTETLIPITSASSSITTTTPTTSPTTIPTTSPITTHTTIPTTTRATIITAITTNPSVPNTTSIVFTPEVTPAPQTTTSPLNTTSNNTNYEPVTQEKPARHNVQFSTADIGIIVGTAVAAILLIILVICVVWKIKVRRRNYTDNEIVSKKSKQRLKSIQNTTDSNILPCTNKQVTNIEESVSQSSTLDMLNEGDDQYDEIRSNYYYVDTAPTTYTNNENSNHEVSQEIVDDDNYLTPTMSTVSDTSSVYHHEVDTEVPTNPYISPNEIDDDTTNYSEVTFSPRETNQELRNKSEAPPSSILATNDKHILDSGKNTRNKLIGFYITPCTFAELMSKRKIATDYNNDHLATESQADIINKTGQILKVDKSINESVEIAVSNPRDIGPIDTVNANTKTESPYYNEL